ncbi:hypothetical protein MKW92_009441 [Papaver armeniacum]|nr:hypothetical protein MKW92_009441 [Papaver armeniacum]
MAQAHRSLITSMVPNEENFVLRYDSSKKGKIKHIKLVCVVDVPGHSRLRPKIDEYLPQAAAAEYLYKILTNAPIVKKRIRLLIMCNKSDKVNAHTKKFIEKTTRASRNAISVVDMSTNMHLVWLTRLSRFLSVITR